ncbi:MAG TPA: GNAT family N-acetyltransferase [Acidimicrobiales bacterium]|nr:GNAT family N-acetyltransferase [Acidimicrobiales bacterium]
MIELMKKSEADLAQWIEQLWPEYLTSMVDAGFTREAAEQNIKGHQERLFLNGRPTPGQHVFDILDDAVRVGTLWIAEPQGGDPSAWFIYDIVIDESRRGSGLGRRAMQAAEQFVRESGGRRLALNVFGPNTVARRLYESMDYRVVAQSMTKDL